MPAEGPLHDTVVIITGSEPLDARAVASIPNDAVLIAADGGLDHALAAGLRPEILVGDLDSISDDAVAWANDHAEIHRHPTDKDLTDTELAIDVAAARHPERLVLVSGGGDRLDHTLAALGALGAPVTTGIPVIECHWGAQYVRVLHGPSRTDLDLPVGTRLSMLALHGPCRGVTLIGTRWELRSSDLPALVGRGVSNEVTTRSVHVAVSTGVVTLFLDPPPPVERRGSERRQPDPPDPDANPSVPTTDQESDR